MKNVPGLEISKIDMKVYGIDIKHVSSLYWALNEIHYLEIHNSSTKPLAKAVRRIDFLLQTNAFSFYLFANQGQ